jgi:hypothetical protein
VTTKINVASRTNVAPNKIVGKKEDVSVEGGLGRDDGEGGGAISH